MALYGRHGEAPLPVIAAASPGDAFNAAIEAVRVAVKYMTPVILLSDGYIANSSEPWRVPDFDAIAATPAAFATEPNGPDGRFLPYLRDPDTLARPWAIPGTPGLEHRVGGLEKQDLIGDVSYDPENHQHMVALRAAKIAQVADDITPITIAGDPESELLIVSWGSTFGAVRAGRNNAAKLGYPAAHVHLRWIHPLPRDLGPILERYRTILVPELNRGQLARVLRSEYLVPTVSLNKVQGIPFKASEISDKIVELLEDPS
jgi:2-oxoglutarate ferredoxin oxidoreductase subunit alpha